MKIKILLLGIVALILAGCATSTRYVDYTNQRFPPKDQYFSMNVYPETQTLPVANPYYVIGKVSIEGYASDGVTPETLTNQARSIARKRGADAIINSRTEIIRYWRDSILRFRGELIVYAPVVTK
ncbi:MAG: hypothetical protein HQL12_08865 [Candidatus Omnitrophica bacterium]|nr:hypothetical protein [Candidatus Omnitrophota bacterium]